MTGVAEEICWKRLPDAAEIFVWEISCRGEAFTGLRVMRSLDRAFLAVLRFFCTRLQFEEDACRKHNRKFNIRARFSR
jgi:hypothetical protein